MSDCDVAQRTRQLGVTVEASDIAIVVAFCRAQSDLNAPPPYIANTGVIKTGENLPPGKPAIVDPCAINGKPIVATMGDCAVKVRYSNGQEQDLYNTVPHAPQGQYYVNIIWGVHHLKNALRSDGSLGSVADLQFKGTLEKR